MGAELSHPIRSKALHRASNRHYRIGSCSMWGNRGSMEDAHFIKLTLPPPPTATATATAASAVRARTPPLTVCGVFDGHCGPAAANFLAKELPVRLASLQKPTDPDQLKECLLSLDQEFMSSGSPDGSTIVLAFIEPLSTAATASSTTAAATTKKRYRITIAHVGDSRALLLTPNSASPAAAAATARAIAAAGSAPPNAPEPAAAAATANGEKRPPLKRPVTVITVHPPSASPPNKSVSSSPPPQQQTVAVLTSAGTSPTADTKVAVMLPTASSDIVRRTPSPKPKSPSDTDTESGSSAFRIAFETADHKPNDPKEYARITSVPGGFVQNSRVDGTLALSRAFGDKSYKKNDSRPQTEQKVICVPAISTLEATADDALVLMCDGLIEQMTNADISEIVSDRLNNRTPIAKKSPPSRATTTASSSSSAAAARPASSPPTPTTPPAPVDLALVCAQLCDTALASGSDDNMTAILITFDGDSSAGATSEEPAFEFVPGPYPSPPRGGRAGAGMERFEKCYREDALRNGISEADIEKFMAKAKKAAGTPVSSPRSSSGGKLNQFLAPPQPQPERGLDSPVSPVTPPLATATALATSGSAAAGGGGGSAKRKATLNISPTAKPAAAAATAAATKPAAAATTKSTPPAAPAAAGGRDGSSGASKRTRHA